MRWDAVSVIDTAPEHGDRHAGKSQSRLALTVAAFAPRAEVGCRGDRSREWVIRASAWRLGLKKPPAFGQKGSGNAGRFAPSPRNLACPPCYTGIASRTGSSRSDTS